MHAVCSINVLFFLRHLSEEEPEPRRGVGVQGGAVVQMEEAVAL